MDCIGRDEMLVIFKNPSVSLEFFINLDNINQSVNPTDFLKKPVVILKNHSDS